MSENHRTEYKRELTTDLEKEVIAFLNTREGGKVYLGIEDDGTLFGINNPDDVQLKIKDRLKNNILPSCLGLFDVLQESHEGKDIIHVNIASGTEKPYHLRKHGMTEK